MINSELLRIKNRQKTLYKKHRQRQQKRHEMGKQRAHLGQARCPTGASTLPHVGTGDAQKMPKNTLILILTYPKDNPS